MPFNMKKLEERRAELMSQLEGMVNTCTTEVRAFNAEETTRYGEILAEVRSIDATIDAAEQAENLHKTERRAAGGAVETRSQEQLEERAFECYLRGIAADEETRAAANMTTGENGALIPTSIANKIISKAKEISPLYTLATHYDVSGSLTIPVYDEQSQEITMAYADEFEELEGSSGKAKGITLNGFLAGALTKISRSLINNTDFDIVSYAIRKMAEAVAFWVENELINGTEGKIEGLSKIAAKVTAAAPTAITADELIDLQEEIIDAKQDGAFWLMSRTTRKAIRKLKDGEGNFLLQKDSTAKWNYSLFSHDVYTSKAMPDMAAGKRAIIYINPKGLAVKVSEKPSVQVLREKYATSHVVGVVCWIEIDSKVEDEQMVAVLQMGA